MSWLPQYSVGIDTPGEGLLPHRLGALERREIQRFSAGTAPA
jgi:hypothetical protein